MTKNPEYIPQIGDRVSVEGVVTGSGGVISFSDGKQVWFPPSELTLVSRPERPLKVGEKVRTATDGLDYEVVFVDGDDVALRMRAGSGLMLRSLSSLTRVAKP